MDESSPQEQHPDGWALENGDHQTLGPPTGPWGAERKGFDPDGYNWIELRPVDPRPAPFGDHGPGYGWISIVGLGVMTQDWDHYKEVNILIDDSTQARGLAAALVQAADEVDGILEGPRDSESSEVDPWKGIQESFGYPTLIGAHLSPIRDQLGAFLADLEQAREHLADDLEKRVNDGNMDEGNSWPIEQNIDNAIGNVRIASQLVNQAQEAIVSVFPT